MMQDLAAQELLKVRPNELTGIALGAGAVLGLGIAGYEVYALIEARLKTIDDERASVSEMIKKNFSTYFIATDEGKRTACDKYVYALISALQEKNKPNNDGVLFSFSGTSEHPGGTLSGISEHPIELNTKKGMVYSAHFSPPKSDKPYLDQSNDEVDVLKDARDDLDLFLRTEGVELLNLVNKEFGENYHTTGHLFELAENFFIKINATRYVILVLMRIAKCLNHPKHPKTGEPVDWSDSMELCSSFRKVLREMHSEGIKNAFTANHKALMHHRALNSFIEKLEGKILKLQLGYKKDLESKLDLAPITNDAYFLLQSMNTFIRTLIYPDHDYVDPAHLIGLLVNLHEIVEAHPEFVGHLVAGLGKKFNMDELELNAKPKTVIDLLALFSEASPKRRSNALNALKRNTQAEIDFHEYLTKFDNRFIQPVEAKLNPVGFFGFITKPRLSAAKKCLVALMALTFEATDKVFISNDQNNDANQQIRQINQRILMPETVYNLDFLRHLDLSPAMLKLLADVAETLYQMLPAVKLLHGIRTFVNNNEHYLLDPEFQLFLDKVLEDLNKKQLALLVAVGKLSNSAEDEEYNHQKPAVLTILSILGDLLNEHASSGYSVAQLSTRLQHNIDRARKILMSTNFDEGLEQNELNLLESIRALANQVLPNCKDASQVFFDRLVSGVKNKNPSNMSSDVPKTTNEIVQQVRVETGIFDSGPIVKPSFAFQIEAFAFILATTSIALLVIGMLVLLSMTFGVQHIPILAALTAPYATGLMIAGFVSAATGGIGLATSYFTSSCNKSTFFKEPPRLKKPVDSAAKANQDKQSAVVDPASNPAATAEASSESTAPALV